MAPLTYQIGKVTLEISLATEIQFPSAADCNSPCWWVDGKLHILTSTGHPVLSVGTQMDALTRKGEVHYTAYRDGGRWIESVHLEPDGTLYGWYHNEPAHLVPEALQQGRQFPLTAPFIGAVVSYDNGASWDDLGLVLAGGPETLELEAHNYWFAGGNGDFTVILDRQNEFFYFIFGTYYKDTAQQGISLARMRFEDRTCPVGKVHKWFQGAWSEPGLTGKVTPIVPVQSSWYNPQPDTFWGPSVHWNEHIQQYVILMNRAIDPAWKQEGIYLSLAVDIANPASWTPPLRILDDTGWYPQVIGMDSARQETDRQAGGQVRLFIHGRSRYQMRLSRPG
jgi:hypothetical protein